MAKKDAMLEASARADQLQKTATASWALHTSRDSSPTWDAQIAEATKPTAGEAVH
jgi:hypothetical protein